jgi:SAM-dependent methyltransferase
MEVPDMTKRVKTCSLDRRPLPRRIADRATSPLAGFVSRQAAHPRGSAGRALARLWVAETAVVNDAALDLLDPAEGEQILEIGFGPGRSLGRMVGRGALVTGVEVSAAMIELAARRNRAAVWEDRLTLLEGDGIVLPLPDATFDGVLSVHTIYFWPEPERTIAELARVLRPGGRVVLAFRGGEHPLPGRLDPAVYRAVTTSQVISWLQGVGFTVEARVPLPGSPTIALVTGRTPV